MNVKLLIKHDTNKGATIYGANATDFQAAEATAVAAAIY
jgi:hypothetical protein